MSARLATGEPKPYRLVWMKRLFAEWLRTAKHDGGSVIMLDLQNLTFIDSTGLRAFVQAWNRASSSGIRLLFFGATGAARQLFEMTGTDYVLDQGEADRVLERFVGPPVDRSPSTERSVG